MFPDTLIIPCVNRLGLAAAGSFDAAYNGVGNGISTIGDAATSTVARDGILSVSNLIPRRR